MSRTFQNGDKLRIRFTDGTAINITGSKVTTSSPALLAAYKQHGPYYEAMILLRKIAAEGQMSTEKLKILAERATSLVDFMALMSLHTEGANHASTG